MQLWPVRSCGLCGCWPRREIGRRADDRHAQVRPDAHGDHVLGHDPAEADAGVVPLRDDVGQAIVDGDLDLDVRMVGQESLQGGPEHRFGRVLVRRDADGAGGLRTELAQRGQLGVDLVQPGAHGPQQAFARVGRRDAARGAGQQPDAEPLFESTDRVAERGLGNAELGCGFGEAARAPDGQEGQEVVQICALH